MTTIMIIKTLLSMSHGAINTDSSKPLAVVSSVFDILVLVVSVVTAVKN